MTNAINKSPSWGGVLGEEISPFYRLWMFITFSKGITNLFCSLANLIQSTPSYIISIELIVLLSSRLSLDLSSVLFPLVFVIKTLHEFISSPMRAKCFSHLILFDLTVLIILVEEYKL